MKRDGTAGRGPAPDTPAAAAARKAQVDAVMWRQIAREIRSLESAKAGQPPLASSDEIWRSIRFMLRRLDIPVEVLLYIDKLQIKRKRNRPLLTIEQRTIAAADLVERVESLTSELRGRGIKKAQQSAIARLAEAGAPHVITPEALSRKYRDAIKELRNWPDFAASHPPRARKRVASSQKTAGKPPT